MDPLEVLVMNLIESQSLILVAQLIVSLSVLKVWLINHRQPTMWRGGDSKTMKEEFNAYGLPDWMMYTVGGLKVAFKQFSTVPYLSSEANSAIYGNLDFSFFWYISPFRE